MTKRVVYIAGCIPTLTCTFIQREIFDLTDLGFQIDTVSMNSPKSGQVSKAAEVLIDSMIFLDRISEFRKVAAFLQCVFLRPRRFLRCMTLFFTATPMQSYRDYLRLGYHLIESCYLATVFRSDNVNHIHSHFIHGPTSLGMFLSVLAGVPFSFTMHASLIWIDPLAFHTKLKECKFCISISAFNKQHVLKTYGMEFDSKIHVVHCGVQLPESPAKNRPAHETSPISVLAVGQLKRRKGFHVLIDAAKILRDRNIPVTWNIVGEGDQRSKLESMIDTYSLHEEVTLAGAQLHEQIPSFLASADIFTLPCVVGDDNTRDGIPVSLMEAMAWRLPVVSTNIVGLPELIESGHDGLLVEPENASALADAISKLAESSELRDRLGAAGAEKIKREFNAVRSAQRLAALFEA